MRNPCNLAGASLALALAACQTSEPVQTQFTQQTKVEAERYAMMRNLQLASLVEQCQSVNESLFSFGKAAMQSWHQRNDATLASVNAAYLSDVRVLQASIGDIKGQIATLKFLMEAKEQIDEDLRDRVLKSSDRANTCQRRLDEFNKESGDLVGNPQYGAVYAQLKKQFPNVALPKKIPDISVTYVPQRNAGRSAYSVESALKEKNCQNLAVFNLDSNWPNELYAATCFQADVEYYYLVHCEWEQCKLGPEKE